jgi:hypothetical protein
MGVDEGELDDGTEAEARVLKVELAVRNCEIRRPSSALLDGRVDVMIDDWKKSELVEEVVA